MDPKIKQLWNEVAFWQVKLRNLDLSDPKQAQEAIQLKGMIARNKQMLKQVLQLNYQRALHRDEAIWNTAKAREGKALARLLEKQWGCYQKDVERLKAAPRTEHIDALRQNFTQSARQVIQEQSVPQPGKAPSSGGISTPGALGGGIVGGSSELLSIAFSFGTLASSFFGSSKEAHGQSMPSDERLKDYYNYLGRWLLHVFKVLINDPSHAKRIQLPRMYEEWAQHPI